MYSNHAELSDKYFVKLLKGLWYKLLKPFKDYVILLNIYSE